MYWQTVNLCWRVQNLPLSVTEQWPARLATDECAYANNVKPHLQDR